MLGGIRGIALTLVASLAIAHADPATDKARSLELFGESDKAYKAGDFERAADLLRKAYALFPEPLLLYNLARALEGLGDQKGAIAQYERYLEVAGNIADRGAIERRIAVMKEKLRAKEVTPPVTMPRQPPPPATVVVKKSYVAPALVTGIGAAGVAAGAVTGLLANRAHDSAVSASSQLDAQNDQHRAQQYATAANVSFIAGGAIAAAGVVWLVARAAGGSSRIQVAPGYVGAEWSWR